MKTFEPHSDADLDLPLQLISIVPSWFDKLLARDMVVTTISTASDTTRDGVLARKLDKKKKIQEDSDRAAKVMTVAGKVFHVFGSDTPYEVLAAAEECIVQVPDLEGLMSALRIIGQVHPIVNAVVSAVNGVIVVFQEYKENERRVQLLLSTMHKMLCCYLVLKPLTTDARPKTFYESPNIDAQTLLERTTNRIVEAAKQCRSTCFTYQNDGRIFRLIKVLGWKEKLTKIAKQFTDLGSELHDNLALYTANTALDVKHQTNKLMSEVGKVTSMLLAMFSALTPDEYLAYRVFVEASGPEPGTDDLALIEPGAAIVAQQEDKFKKLPAALTEKMNLYTFMIGCQRKIDEAFAETAKKLDTLNGKVEDADKNAENRHLQLMKVIAENQAGPHSRIIDPDVQSVWHYMGWKGSVKSKNLVLALRDHLMAANNPSAQLDSHPLITGEVDNDKDDSWALEYLTILRVHPLLEAMDGDSSSYVTIPEINAFTMSRPPGWSLRLWLAYWSFGSTMTADWYFKRFRVLLYELGHASKKVHKLNRSMMSRFGQSFGLQFVERLLSGFSGIEQPNRDSNWDFDDRFEIFKEYVLRSVIGISETLRGLAYQIDSAAILTLITGTATPERSILPVVFVLMKHAFWVVKQAEKHPIDPQELEVINNSLMVVARGVWKRRKELKATWGIHDLDEQAQFGRYFFGLYSMAIDDDGWNNELESGGFWGLPIPKPGYNMFLGEFDMNVGGTKQDVEDRLMAPDYHDQVVHSLSQEDVDESQTVELGLSCDGCGINGLPLYLRCKECSSEQRQLVHTMDLCATCYTTARAIPRREQNPFNHQSHHTMIQIRSRVPLSQYAALIEIARDELEMFFNVFPQFKLAGGDESRMSYPKCHQCGAQITSVPFWDCTDCHNQFTHYCLPCGLDVKRDSEFVEAELAASSTAADAESVAGTLTLPFPASSTPTPPQDVADEGAVEPDIGTDDERPESETSEPGVHEHRWWHTLISISPQPPASIGTVQKEPSTDDKILALAHSLNEERQAAAEHRAQFNKLARILQRFASPEIIAVLEQEMPELQRIIDDPAPSTEDAEPTITVLSRGQENSTTLAESTADATPPEVEG